MSQSPVVGGASDVKDATDEIQELIAEIRDELESKVGKKFSVFKAVSYKSQVVAGINYWVKVQIDDDEYVHVHIFRPLPHIREEPKLQGYQTGKSKCDELKTF